eukprot:SAG22_NODE_3098_length_1944_cov_2.275339_1_plen_91_part_10
MPVFANARLHPNHIAALAENDGAASAVKQLHRKQRKRLQRIRLPKPEKSSRRREAAGNEADGVDAIEDQARQPAADSPPEAAGGSGSTAAA